MEAINLLKSLIKTPSSVENCGIAIQYGEEPIQDFVSRNFLTKDGTYKVIRGKFPTYTIQDSHYLYQYLSDVDMRDSLLDPETSKFLPVTATIEVTSPHYNSTSIINLYYINK